MNTAVKNIAIATVSLAVGAAGGYYYAFRKAEKQLVRHLDEIEAAYKDAIERVQKTGPYTTVDEAAAILVPDEDQEIITNPEEEIDEDYEEVLDNAANYENRERDVFDESTHKKAEELSEPYLTEGSKVFNDPRPDLTASDVRDETEPDPENYDDTPDARANLEDFLNKFKSRSAAQSGGVTLNGEAVSDDDDEPISSVPGFVSVRDPNGPYIISIDEYMDEEESPFSKVEMTYFEGDDTLIDSAESIVPNIDEIIGRHNLHSWGTGTTDSDQVYIRNEKYEIDIEVTRDDNTYSRAILNIIPQEEIQRSMTKPLRMRAGDGE